MSTTTLPIPAIQELSLADDLFEAVRLGWKQATVRLGSRDIQPGPLTFVGAQDRSIRETVEVLHAAVLTLRDLPAEVAQLDGADDAAGMVDVLKRHYPSVSLDSEVTVVLFEAPAA